jgi:hypothetical protein
VRSSKEAAVVFVRPYSDLDSLNMTPPSKTVHWRTEAG